MAHFSFLVGEFSATFKGLIDNKGNYQTTTGHRWVGYYTLNGYGFQDDWYSAGSPYRGTTWRTYDPVNKRWVFKWLQAGTDTPSGFTNGYFYGTFKDGEVHLKATGKDQQGEYMDKIAFYEITKDGFRWKLDRSYDKGKTWIKNMRMVEAKRIN